MHRECRCRFTNAGASAAQDRPKGRTTAVFFAKPEVNAAGYALFFTVGSGCTARNRGERANTCCSSTWSNNVIDSLINVADFARSFRAAHVSCMGADGPRGETRCSVDFLSFLCLFVAFSSFSLFCFASFCFSSFSFISLLPFPLLFLPSSTSLYFLAIPFVPSLASPGFLHFPLFAAVRRIYPDPS